jgi:tRNA threonylcarbamoyladenosine dehydratase
MSADDAARRDEIIDMSMQELKLTDELAGELLLDLWKAAAFEESSLTLLSAIAVAAEAEPEASRVGLLEPHLREVLFEVSTLRNRRLISRAQQDVLRRTVVANFGLSVGSHVAISWMLLSRADAIKIVDFDAISPSNLNRLRCGWESVGQPKSMVTKNEMLRINPFAAVHTHSSTDPDEITGWLDADPAPHVIVDEVDDLASKLMLRQYARLRALPLIMISDVGDNVMLDVERYDREPQPEPFFGLVPDIEQVDLRQTSDIARLKFVVRILGLEGHTEEMLDSLAGIGRDLGGAPQLGATASAAGGIAALAIKKIRLGEDVRSGRYWFSTDRTLVADIDGPERVASRERGKAKLRRMFSID